MIKTIKEHVLELVPGIDPETCRKVIKAYENYYHEWRLTHCELCGKELNDLEIRDTETYHSFHYLCLYHIQYSDYYQLNPIRQKLGLKNPFLWED